MRGLTREQLAARCGVPARSIAAYETAGVEPSWHRVVEIARALRVSLEALAGRDPRIDAPPEAVAAVYRLLRRGSRKRKQEQRRHREVLNAVSPTRSDEDRSPT
jgi:transcriptional regulator with XRE-family HTH domain